MSLITIFQNIRETETPFFKEVSFILDRIKNGKSADLVKRIRKEKDKEKRNELKKLLPAICFSGTFNKRADSALLDHSGIICLDFDGFKKQKELLEHKQRFQKNKFVMSVFISPSGLGLKVLVKIPADLENHRKYFNSLQKDFDSEYFDKTTKNVSRVCYESYDPLIYYNKNSLTWTETEEDEYVERDLKKDIPTIAITDDDKITEILVKWFERKFPMIEGQRNHNIYVLAMALNDFGVNQTVADWVCGRYKSSNFTAREIKATVKSAYSNIKNHGTKYYEDTEAINEITQKLRRGESKKKIRRLLQDQGHEEEVIDHVVEKAEDNTHEKFWSKSDKGVIKVVPIMFKKFLEDNGFYKYCPEGSTSFVFVQSKQNLISHSSEKAIKDFVLEYLENIDDISIYNYFADQTRLFREEFLTLLGTIDVYFIEDTPDTSYLYFKNCGVKITAQEVKPIQYIDIDGFVWSERVIDRMYKDCDDQGCDYKTFVNNICAKTLSAHSPWSPLLDI